MKLAKKDAWKYVSITFPDYTGRKFFLEFRNNITFYDTNWSGGTRKEYKAIGNNGVAGFNAPAPWVNGVEGTTLKMRPDVIIVTHNIFCGKDCGVTIIMHPEHAPKWIEK